MRKFGIFVFFFFFCFAQLFSQSLTEGQKALESGNFQLALKIFENLADQNDTNAQFLLASMFEQGTGVEKNNEKAYFWLFLATKQNPHLQKYLDRIAETLSDESRKSIENACHEWLEKRIPRRQEGAG